MVIVSLGISKIIIEKVYTKVIIINENINIIGIGKLCGLLGKFYNYLFFNF
jgi:hypothetical protein